MDSRRLLVTSALPYANGSIHLGHLVENIQSDVFARFQRSLGRDVLFVCAADTHGTPIEVNARRRGLDPAVMVEQFRTEHERDFRAFDISFDTYDSTNSDENRQFAERVYAALQAGGHVFQQGMEQFYCEADQRFLPDRFVKGRCPACDAADQYGDVCEACHKTYAPTELKAPYCVLCKGPPTRRTSEHLYVRLGDFTDTLRGFGAHLQPEVRAYVGRWLDEGLKDWGISRDGPYFGFRIPGTDNKYFYVWLDAPVGYVSSAARLCAARGIDLGAYWPGTTGQSQPESEIVHFIGKDIIYFHALFWPALLKAAGFQLPSRLHVHGMLNLGGAKMSKSRGRMVSAREWVDALDPSYLRYYIAANLGSGLDDIEFSPDELRNRVNAHLVHNIGNLAQRVLIFAASRLEGRLSAATVLPAEDRARIDAWVRGAHDGFAAIDTREAVRHIEALASWANEYMQRAAPWKSLTTDRARAEGDITLLCEVLVRLATMLGPIVPRLSEALFAQLGLPVLHWNAGTTHTFTRHTIGTPKPLLPPLELGVIETLFTPREDTTVTTPTQAGATPEVTSAPAPIDPIAAEIQYDQFAAVDLRVGIVVAGEKVPKMDKLLKLQVDVGEGQPRQIFAGIAQAYTPDELIGRRVLVVSNLAPRQFKHGVSHGMLLAASGGPRGLVLASVPDDAAPGTRVK